MLLFCMKNMNRVEMFDCAIFFDTLLIKSHKMQIQLNPFSASLGKGAANLFAVCPNLEQLMGQFLQGRNFGCFRSLFLRVKGAHCGAKSFPYMLLAAVTNNRSKLKLFERSPRFWLYIPFYMLSNIYRSYLKGASKMWNCPFGRGQKLPQKIRASFYMLPATSTPFAYLNRPYYHYWILWLYIVVEFPATFTFHCL